MLAERGVAAGVITADEAEALIAQRELVEQVIRVDDFDRDLGASLLQPAIDALHRQIAVGATARAGGAQATGECGLMDEPVYIIDGDRTPFLKARNRPGPFAASDLATDAGRALLLRQRFEPAQLDEVILGCAAPSADEVNIGRVSALRMGCGVKVPGWTVMRNCASGMQSIDSAINNIRAGRSNLVLAGGVDALSRAPLLFSDAMVMWLSQWYAAKSPAQRAALLAKFRPHYFAPVIALMKGLTDPICGLLMGQTAENLAYRFGITRHEMDAYAARSHARVIAAQKAGHFADELVPLYDRERHPLRGGRRRARGLHGGEPGQAEAVLRQEVRQRHRRQQLAGDRRRRVGGGGLAARRR